MQMYEERLKWVVVLVVRRRGKEGKGGVAACSYRYGDRAFGRGRLRAGDLAVVMLSFVTRFAAGLGGLQGGRYGLQALDITVRTQLSRCT